MFEYDVKIALRNLWRRKSFSLLNIFGLAVGIGAALLIFVLIRNERSYDTYHTRLDRIYRVVTNVTYSNGHQDKEGAVPVPLGDALRSELPQLEKVASLWGIGGGQQFTLPGERIFKEDEQKVFFTEPELFDILDYPWISGKPASLKEPYTMAVSRSVAGSWFGGDPRDAVGKTVLLGDTRIPYRITGILEDPPRNTDLDLEVVLSYASYRAQNPTRFTDPESWGSISSSSRCYVLLAPGQDSRAIDTRLATVFSKRHYAKMEEEEPLHLENRLLPLKDLHFSAEYNNYGPPAISLESLWGLGFIGFFLVLVACINFINLSTAQSVNRSREIGVRKVLGSSRPQLLRQFLEETALITGIAILLAGIFAELALPALSRLIERPLTHTDILTGPSLGFLLILGIIVTFLAGFYPALVLSGFDPIQAFRNKVRVRAGGGLSLRRGLVIVQFIIAQLLIIGTLVVVKQMAYFRNRPTGFDREGIALIDLPQTKEAYPHFAYLKDRLSRIPGVTSVTLCDAPPSTPDAWTTDFYFDGKPRPEDFNIGVRYSDTDYLKTFNMRLAAGRLPYPADTIGELLVNETTVRMLGLKSDEEILGKKINPGSPGAAGTRVVGVIADFNDKPLNGEDGIHPLLVAAVNDQYNSVALKIDPRRIEQVMPRVREAYMSVFPQHLYQPSFFDNMVVSYYHVQAIVSELFKIFAALAIFISCLGLYGLVTFMAAQKTKEVGIRKVLGASVQSIVYLFSREFTLLVLLAFIASAPLGYLVMQRWLDEFYYHITLGWQVFAASIVLSVLVAWVTVAYKAVRAATADPIKAIKYE